MRRLICSFAAFIVLVVLASCSNQNAVPLGTAQPANKVLPSTAGVLPELTELGDTTVLRNVSFAVPIDLENAGHTGNATVEPGNVVLPSGASEMSAAWWGFSVLYGPPGNEKRIPYLAPYSMTITCSGGPYWFLRSDYKELKWVGYEDTYTGTQSFEISLNANAGNDIGNFWFAMITYGGDSVTISDITLNYPDSPPTATSPIEYTQFVEMRDGVKLATSVHLPYQQFSPLIPPPPYPVLMFRTPYEKYSAGNESNLQEAIDLLVQGNIVVIVQYFRGRLNDTGAWPDSEGTETLFREHAGPDHFDAVDTVEWLKERHFYNGDLLLAGPSALGLWIYQAATLLGDDVTAIYPLFSAGDVGDWAAQRGGCFKRSNVEGWLTNHNFPPAMLVEAETAYATNDEAYWQAVDFDPQAGSTTCPGWHETGWYDVDVEATIASWKTLNDNGGTGAAGNQWLVIGPWDHAFSMTRPNLVGNLEFPDTGDIHDPSVMPAGWNALDLNGWAFDKLGRALGYSPPANRVLAYFIGEEGTTTEAQNTWYELADWPPPGNAIETFYLNSSSQLIVDVPGTDDSVAVEYDPTDSIPTLGGANLPVLLNLPPLVPVVSGPYDQRPVTGHTDIISFAWPWIVTGMYTFAGTIRANLYVSVTDMADADVMVKLIDVYPDGTEMLIADSAVRLSRYLEANMMGPVVADTVYQVSIDVGDRAFTLGDDHTLRLDIAGSNYPRFDLCPDDGGMINVHVGPTYASSIDLPTFDPEAGIT